MQHEFTPVIAAISAVRMLVAVMTLLVVDALYGIGKLAAARYRVRKEMP